MILVTVNYLYLDVKIAREINYKIDTRLQSDISLQKKVVSSVFIDTEQWQNWYFRFLKT